MFLQQTVKKHRPLQVPPFHADAQRQLRVIHRVKRIRTLHSQIRHQFVILADLVVAVGQFGTEKHIEIVQLARAA